VKIWFTEIGEPLPFESDVRLHRYGLITQQLARLGHEVTWWTSTFSHAKKQFVFDQDCEREFNGVKIKLIHGPGYHRNISFQRIRHQTDFAEKFVKRAKESSSLPDILVSPIPTLETAELATRFARERDIPIVTDIRDEWPEEFVDLAPKPMRPLMKILLTKQFRQVYYICSNVDGIIGVANSNLNYGLKYANRAQHEGDRVLPIGYFSTPLDPEKIQKASEYWDKMGIRKNAFVGCFFGTIGQYFNLDTIIKSARILEKEMDVQFVLCGDGDRLEEFKEQAAGLRSVFFPGWIDGPKIAALMKRSRVGLAPYVKGARMSLPNKPFEYWAGGLPLLSSLQGQTKEILAKNHSGFTYDADSVEQFCNAIRTLHSDPDEASEMGRRARQLLEAEFSVERMATKWQDYLDGVINRHRKKLEA
jgi:glycosyltransferase involved in cell wall biosynthesis